jgi:predicted phage terminase large subunit-like protein
MAGFAGKYQSVSVPPQHGKSRLLAVRAVAWLLGSKPGINVAITGFSRDLLVEFIGEVKSIVSRPDYQALFPSVIPVFGNDRADKIRFMNDSSLIAKSAGSKLTGRKVDWLIIDDAHAGRAEAESRLQRKRVVDWYFADCATRLSRDAKVFIIGTRWHPNDLIGHLTSEDYVAQLMAEGQEESVFEVTNLPAIAGRDDPLGREEGEPLFPEERPLSFLMALKASLPAYEWSSQYEGMPRTASSGQADMSKLKFIDKDLLPDGLMLTRGWDLAVTEKQSADFTAGALCGWDGDQFYIVDIFKRQWTWAKVRSQMIEQALRDRETMNVLRIAVEGVGGFEAIYQDVKSSLLGSVAVHKRNPPRGGKLLRAQPWLNLIEAGRVTIVRGLWTKEFVEELGQFPESSHDDQVDAVSIAFEELTKPLPKLLIA